MQSGFKGTDRRTQFASGENASVETGEQPMCHSALRVGREAESDFMVNTIQCKEKKIDLICIFDRKKLFARCEGETFVLLIEVRFWSKIYRTRPFAGLKGGREKFRPLPAAVAGNSHRPQWILKLTIFFTIEKK